MPLRNLLVILLAAILSLACYEKSEHNRYAATVADAIALIEHFYVEKVDSRRLFENAMNGMVQGLDPYSAYIGPDAFRRMEEDLDQEFGGIGIEVAKLGDDQPLVVLSPVTGGPAQRAGMRSGDEIHGIDGKTTLGMPRQDAVKLMRGKPGAPVKLQVKPQGESQLKELQVAREIIMVNSVLGDVRLPDGSWDFHLKQNRRIGLLRINSFGQHTAREVKEILTDSSGSPSYDACIIDLRGNSGGLLDVAVELCDAFIQTGVIVTTRGRDGEIRSTHQSTSAVAIDPKVPLVVLVNGLSASAAEIVAACLQDHGRAVVIGQRTWGKGTVQNVLELEGGRSALKLTTASYWRPSGQDIHRHQNAKEEDAWGVSPDPGFAIVIDDKLSRALARQRAVDDLNAQLVAQNPALIRSIIERLNQAENAENPAERASPDRSASDPRSETDPRSADPNLRDQPAKSDPPDASKQPDGTKQPDANETQPDPNDATPSPPQPAAATLGEGPSPGAAPPPSGNPSAPGDAATLPTDPEQDAALPLKRIEDPQLNKAIEYLDLQLRRRDSLSDSV